MAKKKPRQNNSSLKEDWKSEMELRNGEPGMPKIKVPEQPPMGEKTQTPTGYESAPPVAPSSATATYTNPAQALTNILEAQQKAILELQKNAQQTNTVLTTIMQKLEVDKEKPQGPQDMLKTVMDLLNGPLGNILNKVVDSIGAPAQPEGPPPVDPVLASDIKKVNAHNDQMAEFNRQLASEMVRGLKLKNDQMDRELHAEW